MVVYNETLSALLSFLVGYLILFYLDWMVNFSVKDCVASWMDGPCVEERHSGLFICFSRIQVEMMRYAERCPVE